MREAALIEHESQFQLRVHKVARKVKEVRNRPATVESKVNDQVFGFYRVVHVLVDESGIVRIIKCIDFEEAGSAVQHLEFVFSNR